MAVKSTKPYIGKPADALENFNGKQLVYLCWERHLLFAAPFIHCVEPDMSFRDFIDEVLVPIISPDPDCANIQWDKVQWSKGGEDFTPDFDKSMADNGIEHKDQLILRTPGLNSICGAAAA